MRKVIAVSAAISIALLVVVSPASAFEGGGRKPSEAPLIAVGQHYTGQLNNHKEDANFGGYEEVAIYRLPPLTTHDVLTVDWHGTPFTHGSGFPVCLVFAQGIDDFNWGSVYDQVNEDRCDEEGPGYGLSGSGTARTQITVQETNANSSYLEFASYASSTNVSELETFPYDFTVEPILHYLAAAIQPVKRISASGILRATANLATGGPAPDGLAFNLAVTWPGGGVASYTGVSSGGVVGFQLALPETAYGKQATFVVSHPADAQYQAVTSTKLEAKVAKPKLAAPSPCFIAERHAQAFAKQLRRLKRHASFARGATRRRLHRRVLRVGRELRAARAQVNTACS
jgi:hypothetical protein